MYEAIQQKRLTKEEQFSELLGHLERLTKTPALLKPSEVKFLENYFSLLWRQAAKAKNQRKTLRDLHKAYRASMMENRWLRTAIAADPRTGERNWKVLMGLARETLWSKFKGIR